MHRATLSGSSASAFARRSRPLFATTSAAFSDDDDTTAAVLSDDDDRGVGGRGNHSGSDSEGSHSSGVETSRVRRHLAEFARGTGGGAGFGLRGASGSFSNGVGGSLLDDDDAYRFSSSFRSDAPPLRLSRKAASLHSDYPSNAASAGGSLSSSIAGNHGHGFAQFSHRRTPSATPPSSSPFRSSSSSASGASRVFHVTATSSIPLTTGALSSARGSPARNGGHGGAGGSMLYASQTPSLNASPARFSSNGTGLSSNAAASAAAPTNELQFTVSHLKRQLADQELALAQERTQRLTAQAELKTYQSSPAGVATDAAQQQHYSANLPPLPTPVPFVAPPATAAAPTINGSVASPPLASVPFSASGAAFNAAPSAAPSSFGSTTAAGSASNTVDNSSQQNGNSNGYQQNGYAQPPSSSHFSPSQQQQQQPQQQQQQQSYQQPQSSSYLAPFTQYGSNFSPPQHQQQHQQQQQQNGYAQQQPSYPPSSGAGAGPAQSSTYFNHMSLEPSPDVLLWNQHLQVTSAANARKLAMMSNLLEEQTKEMISLRSERAQIVAHAEGVRATQEREVASMRSEIAALQDALAAAQSKDSSRAHDASCLANEISMLEDRSRADIQTLLQKLEASAKENHQLRALYVKAQKQGETLAADLTTKTEALTSATAALQNAQASATKYKAKARELVARVREAETANSDLRNQLRTDTQTSTQVAEQLAATQGLLAAKDEELTAMHALTEQLREELLGKTRELSALYEQYAATVESSKRQQAASQAVKDHHELISTISSPLSHAMQLDLHKALAAKQNEILSLSAQLAALSAQLGSTDQREQNQARKTLERENARLREKVERGLEENIRISQEKNELSAALEAALHRPYAAAASSHLSPSQSGSGRGHHVRFSGAPSDVSPQQQQAAAPLPAHLYQQIVEAHESISGLERSVSERDVQLTQLQAAVRSHLETIHALELHCDALRTALERFQSRDLPSEEEFKAEVRRRAKEMEDALAAEQEREAAWKVQAARERAELAAQLASQESFVARAIGIHTEELCGEVDSLSALAEARRSGTEPALEHLVPKVSSSNRSSDSGLSLSEAEVRLSKARDDLRALRRYVADEYAKGLSQACITQ